MTAARTLRDYDLRVQNSPRRKTLRIILASASPRRAELLSRLGIEFEVIASNAEEIEGGRLTPPEIALSNACRKAIPVAEAHRGAIVIGADTVVALGGRLFGKPGDKRAAARMLAALSGKTHEVTTGVCIIHGSCADMELFAETTQVTFRRLASRQIADYLGKVSVLDKAGGYAIQEHGDEIVKRIRGSFTNVVGLPMERMRRALKARPR